MNKVVENVEAGQDKKKVLFRDVVGKAAHFTEDKEFGNFLPKMTRDEKDNFEATIIKDGCIREPLVVFKGKLLDGHIRHSVAVNNKLPFRVVELLAETKDEALIWLAETHTHRRNLTTFAKIEMYLKLKPLYEKIAKTHQGCKDGNFTPIDSLKKIAELGECGKTYASMVQKIVKSNNLPLISDCRTGKKSIRTGYHNVNPNPPQAPNPSPKSFADLAAGTWIDQVKCGDVLELMKELNAVLAGTIPLILTSIPFNNNTDYGNQNNDKKDYKEYISWLGKCIKEFTAALTDGGRLIIECDAIRDEECKEGNGTFRRNIFADLCKIVEAVAPEMQFLGDIVWYKKNPKHFHQTGSRNSCRSPRIARNHSYILIWSKGNNHTLNHFDISTSDIKEGEWDDMVNSVYTDIPAVRDGMKNYGHPAVWPVSLCDRLIRLWTYPDKKNIVLDPFGGVASTAVAALKAGRSYISFDQNPDFCRTGLKRLAEAKAELEKENDPKAYKSKHKEVA